MTRIDGSSPLIPAAPLRRAAKTSGPSGPGSKDFAKHLDASGDAEAAAGAESTAPLGTVTGVLGIQEVDDALSRAAKGRQRAETILDKLEELRDALLTGTLTKSQLIALAQTLATRRQKISDPRLAEILDEIDLRAQVELAKFERS